MKKPLQFKIIIQLIYLIMVYNILIFISMIFGFVVLIALPFGLYSDAHGFIHSNNFYFVGSFLIKFGSDENDNIEEYSESEEE